MTFEVESVLDAIPKATSKLFDFLADCAISEEEHFNLRLSFEESLINAIRHGNRLDPALKVKVQMTLTEARLYVRIDDEGAGFDYQNLKDPTEEENLQAYSGRGVYLMKHLMDEVRYSRSGSTVEMVKILDQQGQ
ncbi:MAG: ATP-binding protein [Candidatus Omnitrophica bacterium]|nr:ATP-binding protein [Candidatus Omnitrophota bacterium]